MLSPALISTITELALNKRVQDAASKLVGRVYGRVFSSSEEAKQDLVSGTQLTLQDLADRIERLPTSDEIATAFALLQAQSDRQFRIILTMLSVILVAAAGLLAMDLVT